MRANISNQFIRAGGGAMAFLALAAFAAPAVSGSPDVTRLALVQPSGLTLNGSSNVAKWHCAGQTVHGSFEIPATAVEINAAIDELATSATGSWRTVGGGSKPKVELSIPIATLDCGNPKMKRDMDRALKSDRYPDILFRFIDLRGPIVRHGKQYRATVVGELSLAGVKRNVDLTVETTRIDASHFRIQSSIPMLMTDFGITPPTGLFGMIKARNRLVVGFDLRIAISAQPTGLASSAAARRK